ncbi:MAG TPA: GDSL-type esterase/lipase family protein [Chthoniobacteraceae bacterium]|jgi:lysophospholipase L1-like esterase|nr:GDSL-type esterase/lipase family protein [Chthoniobacteraceae bacterium]
MPLVDLFSPRPVLAALAFAFLLPIGATHAEAPKLTLKDGDVWVMAGDSITAQRMHTNYIEAFYRTRYPNLHLHFRNSGIGGNRAGSVLKRFDYDVAAWKPTIVSVELGMNDVGGPVDQYINGLRELIGKIRAIGAQPVLISSSPVDDGSVTGDWKSPRCESLHPFTEALQKLATEEKVVFVDQYHALLDVWGRNRRAGAEAAEKAGTPPPVAPVVPAGTPPKPAPIPPSLIPLHGDTVHPGDVGQYTMATVILNGLGASGEVSSATISADGKVVDAKRCKITDAAAKDGTISFTRLDEASPWPILPSAKPAAQLVPKMLQLSQYTLTVTGLKDDASYAVTFDGKPAAVVTGRELAAGWNMTTAYDSVLGARATALLSNNLIGKLEGALPGGLNGAWRAASQAGDAEKLAAAQKEIESTEAEIQTACQPVALHVEIAPAK